MQQGLSTKMTSVREALRDKTFHDFVWKKFGISPARKMTSLTGDYLYDDVSAGVHHTPLSYLYLPHNSPSDIIEFYSSMLQVLDTKQTIFLYSGEAAAKFAQL